MSRKKIVDEPLPEETDDIQYVDEGQGQEIIDPEDEAAKGLDQYFATLQDEEEQLSNQTQGKWKYDYNALLQQLITDFTGYHRRMTETGKVLRTKISEPMMTNAGAYNLISVLKSIMHKGINLSYYKLDEINERLMIWDELVIRKLRTNHVRWKMSLDSMRTVHEMVMTNIEGIFRKAMEGKELDYSYNARSAPTYTENTHVDTDVPEEDNTLMSKFRNKITRR